MKSLIWLVALVFVASYCYAKAGNSTGLPTNNISNVLPKGAQVQDGLSTKKTVHIKVEQTPGQKGLLFGMQKTSGNSGNPYDVKELKHLQELQILSRVSVQENKKNEREGNNG